MSKKYVVAVVGATGAVGREMILTLEQRKFPVKELRLLASERSAGLKLPFCGQEIDVQELKHTSFKDVDYALFSAGASISKEFAPSAAKDRCIVIDNTSHFRMDPDVPLVVPEVNPGDVNKHFGIIANPNCSTIQMVVALKPLYDYSKIRRIVVSTYQSVSGAGKEAMMALTAETKALVDKKSVKDFQLKKQIGFNLIPHIDVFEKNGYTKEEMKMVNETRKIFGDSSITVCPTCVRVPVYIGHSEVVAIETERKIDINTAKTLLSRAPGVKLVDEPEKSVYPMPIDCAGKDEVFVGRLREDLSIPNGLVMWVVSDNLRKGAALNAVQIAELMINRK